MLDPKVSNLVSKELEQESIVVFDEAHNIDNVCIEALSVTLDKRMLDASVRSIGKLQSKVADIKEKDINKLQNEYKDLVKGLSEQSNKDSQSGNGVLANPVLSDDILQEAVPGNIRKAEHFVAFLKKIVMFLKDYINNGRDLEIKSPLSFLHQIHSSTALDRKPLRFTYSRLNSLMRTLEVCNNLYN
jgi:DNA excision repair protein ERCC-2